MSNPPQPQDRLAAGRLPRWNPGERTRVLYVDDHSDSTELIGIVMGDAGFYCRVANTYAEAQSIIRRVLFDLYIVDHQLPDGSGVDLIQEIRKNDTNTPVIFVSADAQNSVQERALRAGAHSAFAKPIDPYAILISAKQQIAEARIKRIDARNEERAAILDTLTEQARFVADTLGDAKASIDRARAIRFAARTAFHKAGGSPADFRRLWDASITRTARTKTAAIPLQQED